MKTHFLHFAAGCALMCCTATDVLAQENAEAVPTQRQIDWQEMETYAFLHYSINTYTDEEWGYGNAPAELFNPSNLDARQWARVCREAGMKGIILTAKHHSGFCLWPSAFTDYSVKNSPWKDGNGDVVKELADACREEGLKFAVYLSPWDRNHPLYGQPEYVDYFRNQLRELLGNYGDVFEVWFDGANGGTGWYGGADERRTIDANTYYGWEETFDIVRELQPDCFIWNGKGWNADGRWVGNENGEVGLPNWSMLRGTQTPGKQQLFHGDEDGDRWVPGEADVSIRPGWFYHEKEDSLVKDLAKLMDIYYKSVGRNGTMLLNFPIRPDGLIDSRDSISGARFGRYVSELFGNDLAALGERAVAPDSASITFTTPVTFDRMVLQEDITRGQRIKAFEAEALVDGQWIPVTDALAPSAEAGSSTMGYKRILCFEPLTADAVRVKVTDTRPGNDGKPLQPFLKSVTLHKAPPIEP